MARFNDLPRNASLTAIYGRAGEIFEEQVKGDPETDYTEQEPFNKAVWFIAEAAQRQDFINLRGKSKEKIAREMGDSISRWWRNRGSQS
jgi:hypothetical protein